MVWKVAGMQRALVSIKVAAPVGTAERLSAAVAAERARVRALEAERGWSAQALARMRPADARAARAARRAHLAELRDRGRLRDSQGRLLVPAVTDELAARGWEGPWPEPGPEAPAGSGRWPGVLAWGYPEQVGVRLPAHLAATVRAACWATSAEAIGQILALRDQAHPLGVRDVPELWQRYLKLAEQVTSPGALYRAAIERALA